MKIIGTAVRMHPVPLKISGGDSYGETPVPIPNTAVKSATLKILTWRRVGKISTAEIKKSSEKSEDFFLSIRLNSVELIVSTTIRLCKFSSNLGSSYK